MAYLIDTDWIIDYLKGKKSIVNKLQKLFDEGLVISVISLAELYEGIFASKDPKKHLKTFQDFLSGVVVLGITDEICQTFGRLRAEQRKVGVTIDNFDLLIASTVLVHDLTILTDNVKHFKKIKGIKIESSR
jgi:tRNA(fMet)-specific endonuclease VapC